MLKAMVQVGCAMWLFGAALVGVCAEPGDGEAIGRARCTGCHNLEKLKRLASRTAEDQRAAKLERFLPSHNLPKADERVAVIAWLMGLTKPAPVEAPAAAPAAGTLPEGAAPPSEPATGSGTDTR